MSKERILITVKTYPVISSTYDELVCTAGVKEDGSWVRIYPVQYRQIDDYERKYQKWDWIEIDIIKNTSDHRIESFRPVDQDSIRIIKSMGKEQNWYERRQTIIENGTVYHDLDELISLNKQGKLSLATFKPSNILDLEIKPDSREWDIKKLDHLEQKAKQQDLFSETSKIFNYVKKLPYKFCYKFSDSKGRISTLMIEDWEIGQLFWNALKKHKDESVAVQKVKDKYFDEFTSRKDLYLFLGTTKEWDKRSNNPFIIIGVFYPPQDNQKSLF